MFIKIFLIFFFSLFSECLSDQIIKDAAGDFYLLKNDGSYKKLPPPKPGHTYKIIKKNKDSPVIPKKSIFSRVKKKGRKKTNTRIGGF